MLNRTTQQFTVPYPRHKSKNSKIQTNAETDEAKNGKIQNTESEGSLFGI
jgi:hypothetical protein